MLRLISNNRGFIITALIALITFSPVIMIIISGMSADSTIWSHLRQYVLPGLLKNTAVLLCGVLAATAAIGISLAWLTSFYDFFGRFIHQIMIVRF